MFAHTSRFFLKSRSTTIFPQRFFALGIDTVIISALAATSTTVFTFFMKQRQMDRLRNEIELSQYRIREMESQLSLAKSAEERFHAAEDELAKKTLESTELRASLEKLDILLNAETANRLKVEEEFYKATERMKTLEIHLDDVNSKHIAETRQLAECRGRLESAHAAVQLAKEQAQREKDARTNLEKTIETSLKINIDRIRDELLSRTRDAVGTGVIETLKSSLRQTPVLGRFGEIQLNYLLHEYFTLGELKLYEEQVTLQSKKRLDAVLKLPVNDGVLHIIIDAKTPNIFQTEDKDSLSDTTVAVTQVRSRLVDVLNALSKADYVEHYRRHLASKSSKSGGQSGDDHHVCDFVLMFLPMDYALLAVDEKLLRKCMDAKVVVCTPSLLGLQIEFIKMAWRQKLPSDAVAHVEEDFTTLSDSLDRLNKDLEKCGSSLRLATTKAEKATARLKNSVTEVFLKAVKEA